MTCWNGCGTQFLGHHGAVQQCRKVGFEHSNMAGQNEGPCLLHCVYNCRDLRYKHECTMYKHCYITPM